MIFTQSLQKINYANPTEAIKKMVQHINYIQSQLEYTLTTLDSQNIIEIDTDKTIVGDSTGTNVGSYINYKGKNGERFTVGTNSRGKFEFVLNGADKQMMYLDNDGRLVITENAHLTIDGGEW